jgi:hypothetical protein
MDTHELEINQETGRARRIVAFLPIDVPCPTCEVEGGVPCVGSATSVHAERIAWCDELAVRIEGSDGKARWYRHQFAKGLFPRRPRPHGTEAAWMRHKRNGEQPCAACVEAMRPIWRERSKARTAKRQSAMV